MISNYSFTDFYDRLKTRTELKARIELDQQAEKKNLERFKAEYLATLPNETTTIYKLDKQMNVSKPISRNVRQIIEETVQKSTLRIRHGNKFSFALLYERSNGEKYVIVTSAVNTYYNKYAANLRFILISVLVVSVFCVVLLSIWLSKRLISPIKEITMNIQKISSENLHVRLNASNEQDELGQLTGTLNGMFDRLETSFEAQNNFISNASHELNTPLTSILGETEMVLQKERSKEEYEQALQRILIEAEKLNHKTQALLSLAQTGFNGKSIHFEKLSLDTLLIESIETVHRLQPQSTIQIRFENMPPFSENLIIRGNKQLLLLAFSNVLLNASKYSNNATVWVDFECNSETIAIIILDKGIGIPKEDLPFIYDPFFRASNTDAYKGYGIGLPLTRNIMRIHGARLDVYSEENSGTQVKMTFSILK
jgi:signal transduction histidine kinase